jgi:hypothetical protein
MMARRTISLLALLTAALLCMVDAYRNLRTSSSSNINTEERRTNDADEEEKEDEVLASQKNQKQQRELWGREYSFGTLPDRQRPEGTSNDEDQYLPKGTSLLGNVPSDGIELDVRNPLIGNVVPIGSAYDSGDIDNPLLQQNALQPRPRIVGGTDDADLAPFAMQLTYDGTDQSWRFAGCAATLISNCHVLTAAHCVIGLRDVPNLGVYVNAWRPFNNNSDGTVTEPFHFSPILNILSHPAFDETTSEYDVAVLTMSTCASGFEIMEIADPAFMEGFISNDLVKVAGFGQLAVDNLADVATLQSVEVPFISGIDCSLMYYGNLILGDMICAGFPEGGKDACLGDSGVSILFLGKVLQTWICSDPF